MTISKRSNNLRLNANTKPLDFIYLQYPFENIKKPCSTRGSALKRCYFSIFGRHSLHHLESETYMHLYVNKFDVFLNRFIFWVCISTACQSIKHSAQGTVFLLCGQTLGHTCHFAFYHCIYHHKMRRTFGTLQWCLHFSPKRSFSHSSFCLLCPFVYPLYDFHWIPKLLLHLSLYYQNER